MAEHTQNALRDPRASLLVTEPVPDGADPLASGRVTLMGEMRAVDPSDRDLARERYLDANPAAGYYIDFGDFDFYRLTVQTIRYVGGYGRMSWVEPDAYAAAESDPLVDAAAGIIEHMNADHADAQVLFCRHFAGLPDTTSASMSAVDRYGFEMIAVSDAGRTAARLGFPNECLTATTSARRWLRWCRRRALRSLGRVKPRPSIHWLLRRGGDAAPGGDPDHPAVLGSDISGCAVQHRHLVPQHEIAGRPVMPVLEVGAADVREKEAQHGVALGPGEAHDVHRVSGVHEQRSAAALGVGDHDGPLAWWVLRIEARLGVGPVLREIQHFLVTGRVDVHRGEPVDEALHRRRQRVVGRAQTREPGVAADWCDHLRRAAPRRAVATE